MGERVSEQVRECAGARVSGFARAWVFKCASARVRECASVRVGGCVMSECTSAGQGCVGSEVTLITSDVQ